MAKGKFVINSTRKCNLGLLSLVYTQTISLPKLNLGIVGRTQVSRTVQIIGNEAIQVPDWNTIRYTSNYKQWRRLRHSSLPRSDGSHFCEIWDRGKQTDFTRNNGSEEDSYRNEWEETIFL